MSKFNSFSIEGADLLKSSQLERYAEEETEGQSLKDAIIDLYLNVKIRNSDDVSLLPFKCPIDRQLQRRQAQG